MTTTSTQVESVTAADESAGSPDALLEVRGLKTHFFLAQGIVRALEGVDFTVQRGQTVGLVGERRLRQVDHGAFDHGDCAIARAGGGG